MGGEGGKGREGERERFVMFHYKYHRSQEASWASFIFHNMLLEEPAFPVINHLLFYRGSTSDIISFWLLFLQSVALITSFNMLKCIELIWIQEHVWRDILFKLNYSHAILENTFICIFILFLVWFFII